MTSSLPEILYKGSVKNVRGNASDDYVFFEFSDRYSIFDWGEMPDLVDGKGASLAAFTDVVYAFLEDTKTWKSWTVPSQMYHSEVTNFLESSKALAKLKENGMLTHRYAQDARIGNCWKVKKIAVPSIQNRNYDFYKTKPVNTLVPLEVIFRFGTPSGSSLLKRLAKNPDYMYSLGLTQMPKEQDFFDRPVIEFSTKLESSDRYITPTEAKEIAGLTEGEFNLLYSYAAVLSVRLREEFTKAGLELWDGKFEFSFIPGTNDRDFMLVDSMGPDEVRLTCDNVHLSKEVLRQVYMGTEWQKQIDVYKGKSEDWQKKMKQDNLTPSSLPKEVKDKVVEMYQLLALLVESYFLKNEKQAQKFTSIVSSLKQHFRKGGV
ncbi:MAG: hypothetical protein KDD37_02120 [Bdellovibrionales bacterium]|nr:hypothetical protein [Bdellovibrionales bacterium]